MDDDVELRRLREQVYGVDGAGVTPAVIARLAELEERARPTATGDVPEASTDEAPDATPPAPPQTPPARGRARWALTALAAVGLVGIGVLIGSSLALASSPASTPDPAAADFPELTFPQTVEDVIAADVLRDSGIDASSTRYIATVSDFRIYLARPDDGDGRCIATFTSTDNRPWSAGCASGAQVGAAVFGVDDSLSVAIGEPVPSEVGGIPIRLSASVTAFVAR